MPGYSGIFRRSSARPRPRPSGSSPGAGPRPGGAGPGRPLGPGRLPHLHLHLRHRHHGAGAALVGGAAALCAALVASTLIATTASAAPPSPSAVGSVRLAGVRPAWATAADATGIASAATSLTTRVFLAGRDPRGLAAYATAVSTPGDASYRRFLSASAAAAEFAPSATEGTAVAAWLRSAGLEITSVTPQYVDATGAVGAIDKAYGVTLKTYRHATSTTHAAAGSDATNATTAIAPDRDPAVPSDVAGDVATITGLSTFSRPMYTQHVTAATADRYLQEMTDTSANTDGGSSTKTNSKTGQNHTPNQPTGPLIPTPCSTYYGQLTDTTDPAYDGVHEPYAVCGYSASQLRSAYGATGHEGHGATVAIVDAYGSPTMLADADTWSAHNGLPAFAAGQYAAHVTPSAWNDESACGGTAGWASEQSLDVEAVHAMAPAAKVLYYGADSCQDSDLLAALSDLITHHLAQVISDSWGGPIYSSSGDEPASTIAEYEHLFQLAAVEGITVNFSSGDCGDNDPSTGCGHSIGSTTAQTTFPASDPWVTAVGGTSAAIGARGHLDWSASWGTDAWLLNASGTAWQHLGWVFGGGGGTAADFAEPGYQRHDVPSALADTLLSGAQAASPRRVVPDLALDGDPFTGMLVGYTQPLPDGTTGYAEAAIGGTSLASPLLSGLEADTIAVRDGVPIGFVNPTLYCGCMRGWGLRDVTDSPSNVAKPIAEVFPPFQGQVAALAGIGQDGILRAASGYDDATGLGTPGPLFIDALAAG